MSIAARVSRHERKKWGCHELSQWYAEVLDGRALGPCRRLEWASVGLAQSPVEPGIGPSSEAAPQFSAADNAWVLVSSALVLFMTVPALALFYSGLVRRKNVLSVMMQCVFLMCVMTILWALYGYSLVFGGNGPWIGDTRYMLMQGVDADWRRPRPRVGRCSPDLRSPC